jgi:hypothetical protein
MLFLGLRRAIALLAVPFLIGSSLRPSAAQSSAQPSGQEVLVDQLLSEVQLALAKVQQELKSDDMPPLESVTLDLTAEAKKDAGGKINLFIVSFGKKWEKDLSQEIEVTLKPPGPNLPLKVGKGPSVSDELQAAILSAARGVQKARGDKQVPLVTSAVKVVLTFVVKGDTSGGIKFTIAPVTIDLSGELADSATQKITVNFGNPDKKK